MWMQGNDRVLRFLLALSLTICLGAGFLVTSATAQSFGLDAFSPLLWFPNLEAEVQVRPILVNIGSGALSSTRDPSNGGGLRDTFKLTRNELFVDIMARLQLSRLSFRIGYAPRDFAAFRPNFTKEARLTYTGIVLGADFDVIQWNRTRLGIDFDYDLFSPTFTYPIVGQDGVAKISGQNAVTLGFHASYNPLRTLWGMSPIAEFRARWPVSDTQVTDWEVAAGVASPNTVIGSWSLMGGYRNTRLGFKEEREGFRPAVDCTFDGWFGELAYYY